MRGFAVQRFHGNDAVNKHHFSVLSPVDSSVIGNFNLPYYDDNDFVHIGSCGSLLYFIAGYGRIVVWNSEIKQFKVVEPADSLPAHRVSLISTGLGYDAKSQDYKLLRYCEVRDKTTHGTLGTFFDLYSLKCGTAEKLKTPDVDMIPETTGVYIWATGSCYWTAVCPYRVVSFDFATNTFDHFPLPDAWNPCAECKLVDFYGYLGALVYRTPCQSSPSPLIVKVFARRETVWELYHDVTFDDKAEIPLGLTENLLFFEAKDRRGVGRLMVCDLVTNTSKKLDITDYRLQMVGVSYDETTYPDSIPVTSKEEKKKKKQRRRKKKKKKTNENEKDKEKDRCHIPHSGEGEEVELLPLKLKEISIS